MDQLVIKHESEMASIAPKDPNSYRDLSLAALTVYSLYWLHQWELRRTIEGVAILNWRLFPDKFGMVGFSISPTLCDIERNWEIQLQLSILVLCDESLKGVPDDECNGGIIPLGNSLQNSALARP